MSDIISELREPTMCYDMVGRCYTESTMEEAADYIEQLKTKLAAAEADAVAQRDKVRVMRETLEELLAYVETGYGDFGSDEGAQAHEALATTEDV